MQGFCAPPDAGTRDAGPPQVGVPPGTVLNPLQGDQSFVTDGQVIEAKDITGCVTIAASNITVRKSRITCNGFYGITIRPPATGTRVEDVELRGTTADAFVAFEGAEATLSRVDIHGFKRALDLSSNVTVEASSIHDLLGDGAAAVGCAGGTGLHLRNNRIDRGPASGVGPALRFQTDNGPLSDVWLEANFLNGGPYTLEVVERANGAVTGLHVLRNRFGRDFVDGPLHLGGIAAAVDVSGNVFDDTGEAVP
ncbi:MAG: right-handed parallel beta-helix repeat-containing protein [Archangiaceae bacterium]|nr:right-handed parallel beta-helix repeat-containing protein [Archangiaceae bacterium]